MAIKFHKFPSETVQEESKRIKTILLIDDDTLINSINKEILHRSSVCENLITAENGLEGIEILRKLCEDKEECPEIIFLDLNMPVMDGLEFYKLFRNLPFNNKETVKTVLLTSSALDQDIQKALKLGVNMAIKKPLTDEKIINVLNMIL